MKNGMIYAINTNVLGCKEKKRGDDTAVDFFHADVLGSVPRGVTI